METLVWPLFPVSYPTEMPGIQTEEVESGSVRLRVSTYNLGSATIDQVTTAQFAEICNLSAKNQASSNHLK